MARYWNGTAQNFIRHIFVSTEIVISFYFIVSFDNIWSYNYNFIAKG